MKVLCMHCQYNGEQHVWLPIHEQPCQWFHQDDWKKENDKGCGWKSLYGMLPPEEKECAYCMLKEKV